MKSIIFSCDKKRTKKVITLQSEGKKKRTEVEVYDIGTISCHLIECGIIGGRLAWTAKMEEVTREGKDSAMRCRSSDGADDLDMRLLSHKHCLCE